MIRVLIADDQAIVREGVKRILSDVPDIVVAGEASNGAEALERVQENGYDVVLLDIGLPALSGLDVLRRLRARKPDLRVLMVSMYQEAEYAVRALKGGAYGFVARATAPEELVEAIRKVSLGRRYITTSLAERLADYIRTGAERPLHENLSDREYQVLCLIASGKTSREIAEELSLSRKTITMHRARTLKKMGMKTTAELIRYAVDNQLVY